MTFYGGADGTILSKWGWQSLIDRVRYARHGITSEQPQPLLFTSAEQERRCSCKLIQLTY